MQVGDEEARTDGAVRRLMEALAAFGTRAPAVQEALHGAVAAFAGRLRAAALWLENPDAAPPASLTGGAGAGPGAMPDMDGADDLEGRLGAGEEDEEEGEQGMDAGVLIIMSYLWVCSIAPCHLLRSRRCPARSSSRRHESYQSGSCTFPSCRS